MESCVVFSSSRAVFHSDDKNINEFSEKLYMAFSDFNLQHRVKRQSLFRINRKLVVTRSFSRCAVYTATRNSEMFYALYQYRRQDLCLELLVECKLDGEIGVNGRSHHLNCIITSGLMNSFAVLT